MKTGAIGSRFGLHGRADLPRHEIFEQVLRVASGERSKSELLGYGDAEFVPWQIGATM